MATGGLKLPKEDANVLVRLSRIPNNELQALFDSLQGVEPRIYIQDQIVSCVADFANKHGFQPKDVAKIVVALNRTKLQSDLSDADYVSSVLDAVTRNSEESDVDLDKVQIVVVNVMSLEQIRLSIKGHVLAFDAQQHLHNSSLICDLRPVFGNGPENVSAFFIAQTLKIEYASFSEDAKQLYLVLDDDDLEALELAISRARKKKQTLLKFAKDAGAKILEMKK